MVTSAAGFLKVHVQYIFNMFVTQNYSCKNAKVNFFAKFQISLKSQISKYQLFPNFLQNPDFFSNIRAYYCSVVATNGNIMYGLYHLLPEEL